jgi:hypothetical protein
VHLGLEFVGWAARVSMKLARLVVVRSSIAAMSARLAGEWSVGSSSAGGCCVSQLTQTWPPSMICTSRPQLVCHILRGSESSAVGP